MQLFSEREGVKHDPTEIISNRVWLGITAIIQQYIGRDNLSKDFPLMCPDGKGICGFDAESFNHVIGATIRLMSYPFPSFNYIQYDPFSDEGNQYNEKDVQYAIVDTIEFVHSHIFGVIKDLKNYHDFFNHYELCFTNGEAERASFRDSINQLFERNGIVFHLEQNGQVIRTIMPKLGYEINSISTQDDTVDLLLTTALSKIQNPKLEERKIGLERLWDAFERIKTVYDRGADKANSVNKLLDAITSGQTPIKDKLEEECKALTKIGNQFQIRHFESDKVPVTDPMIVDYLFLRLYSLVKLLIMGLQKK